jgi:hypothetical protein
MADKTPDEDYDEFLQKIMPGSKTFPARLLCPCCGWHFKNGITDPTGSVAQVVPDIVLVCGQCLHILKTNEKLELVALTKEEVDALDDVTRAAMAATWHMAMISLLLVGPEPRGPVQ